MRIEAEAPGAHPESRRCLINVASLVAAVETARGRRRIVFTGRIAFVPRNLTLSNKGRCFYQACDTEIFFYSSLHSFIHSFNSCTKADIIPAVASLTF